LGIGPNPQSPIPNPQSPIPNPHNTFIIKIKINELEKVFDLLVNTFKFNFNFLIKTQNGIN
jgi:hypothetical protein